MHFWRRREGDQSSGIPEGALVHLQIEGELCLAQLLEKIHEPGRKLVILYSLYSDDFRLLGHVKVIIHNGYAKWYYKPPEEEWQDLPDPTLFESSIREAARIYTRRLTMWWRTSVLPRLRM